MRSRSIVLMTLLGLLALTNTAHASTEINGLFDARSAGMGGTGIAYLDSAGAIPTNPALLDKTEKLTISADIFYIISQPEAPYPVFHLNQATGEYRKTYETYRSESVGAPLPFIGAAYRLTDRIVIGIAAYPVIGQGTSARYRPAPDELPDLWVTNNAAMGLIEAAESLSIRILDNLSVGVNWRITYMTQTVSSPVPTGPTMSTGAPPAGVILNAQRTAAANADIKVTGINFAGAQLGVLYKPIPSLSLGFSYRSKVVVNGEGTTTIALGGSPMSLETRQGYTNPHMFRAGFALGLADDKLLLAADFKYLLYAEAFKELKTVTVMNGREMTKFQPAYWKNAYTVQLGAEYKAGSVVRLRAGYILASSATPKEYALAFMAPPGLSHLVGGGLGLRVHDNWNVDLAAAYVVLSSYIDVATDNNNGIGTYASHGGEFSLSATYHM